MNETKSLSGVKIGFALCTVLLGALTSCTSHDDGQRHRRAYAEPPSVYVESGVVVQPDYVYYPGYQVYYSSNTRQYVYQDGRSWVSRPAPPRVPVDVLLASPSVRLAFHDSPAIHHAAIVQQYPKHWAPPSAGPNHGEGKQDDGNDRGGRK
jgi:hypothetical protein